MSAAAGLVADLGPGVVAHELAVPTRGGTIRGVLVTPDGPPRPRPTVVVGHDLGGEATAARYLDLMAAHARGPGFTSAIIDGPFHGARRTPEFTAAFGTPAPPGPAAMGPVFAAMARPGVAAAMAADWVALVDLLVTLPEVDGTALAFQSVSMSSLLGPAFLAREPRVRAAVLHTVGLRLGTEAARGGPELGGPAFGRVLADIGERPVLVIAHSEDETFSRDSTLALYDALTGPEKELVFVPGPHRSSPAAAQRHGRAFLAHQLGAPS